MTRLFNEPAAFADEMIEGFVASHGRWVRRVSGGVVRSTQSTPGTVALVIGGGSGHYPAFAGLVGQGLAHGAAMGNLFASPSAQQVYNVAKAANNGGGVLLGYGNYAGDVLHFTQAQEKLRREGIDCRSIAVTDDISSAPIEKHAKRRGIAGDLTVFKVAAAASEAGYAMDDVVQIAERANHRTRSFGVAFTGCTLPGAEQPLFTVPEGRMAVGMGIHGEPGIGETDIPTADELAELLVAKLLAEVPDGIDSRRCPRRPHPQRPGQREVRGTVRGLPPRRPAPRRSRARGRGPAGGRARDQLRHGRHLPDPLLAGRRTRTPLARPGRRPGLPPRRGHGRRRWRPDDGEAGRRRTFHPCRHG